MEEGRGCSCLSWLREERRYKKITLVVVFIALFLDQLQLTVIVPVIPSYLYILDAKAASVFKNQTFSQFSLSAIQNNNRSESHQSLTPHNFTDSGQPLVLHKSTDSARPLAHHKISNPNCPKEALLLRQNVRLGLLFASKSIVQLLFNPITGFLTDKIGYHIPMFVGFCVMFVSTVLFALSSSYFLLVLARSLQGVGSSFSSASGMGLLLTAYTDNQERGKAMGIAMGGLAIGAIVGPPFGSVMYNFLGKMAPFLVLAALALFDGALQLLIFQPPMAQPERHNGTPLLTLLRDPYILTAASAVCFSNMAIGMLEATLPLWMMERMCASKWQLGMAFLPASLSFLVGSSLVGVLTHQMWRWLTALLGLLLMGISTISIPFAENIYHLILPSAASGFAIGMVHVSMMLLMGNIVDQRHVSGHDRVYAIADVAICAGFALGPAIAGPIVQNIGFPWLMRIIGMVNIMYSPFCFFLRNPPTQQEKTAILEQRGADSG